jgi:hypothetical protein
MWTDINGLTLERSLSNVLFAITSSHRKEVSATIDVNIVERSN